MTTATETSRMALRPGRHAEQRQDRAVQRADRQPAEGRELSGRHRRAQGRRAADAVRPPRRSDRPAGHLFAARPQPRRGDHPRRRARPARQRGRARSAALRRRRHQSSRRAPPRHRIEARRPADAAGAQHDRHRAPARHRHRSRQAVRRARRAGGHLDRGAARRHRGSAAPHRRDGGERGRQVASKAPGRRRRTSDLRAAQREADRVIKAAVGAADAARHA